MNNDTQNIVNSFSKRLNSKISAIMKNWIVERQEEILTKVYGFRGRYTRYS